MEEKGVRTPFGRRGAKQEVISPVKRKREQHGNLKKEYVYK